ncbi:LLM class flavin-dependent oxidoreductase [Rhizorhabdus argentea]|uniref:LLM class flavin-dependent oxidoreductase n=1 Tax=Rhizorhabdus argentea TaxID=1387174 RepID=UPI0030EB383F
MRFGFSIPTLTAFPRSTENYEGGTRIRYERTYEICQLAEELGYDFGTIGQHRFSPEVIDASAPLMVLAALAAKTKTLKLCTNITLIATHPVIDFAEQVATVDEISGGRLILTVALGYRPYEYESVGLNFKERVGRLEEGVEILRRAWRGGPVHFDGKYLKVPGVVITPPITQEGGPPIWIGADVEKAISRAARIADGWVAVNTETITSLTPKIARFKREAAEHGNKGTVAIVRKVGVGKTRQQVEDEWFPDILKAFQTYVHHNVVFENKEFEEVLRSGKSMRLNDFPDDLFVAGTPGECIDQIRDIQRKTGCEYIICDFGRAAHGAPYDRLREMIELFGREVIPAFSPAEAGV